MINVTVVLESFQFLPKTENYKLVADSIPVERWQCWKCIFHFHQCYNCRMKTCAKCNVCKMVIDFWVWSSQLNILFCLFSVSIRFVNSKRKNRFYLFYLFRLICIWMTAFYCVDVRFHRSQNCACAERHGKFIVHWNWIEQMNRFDSQSLIMQISQFIWCLGWMTT